VGVATLRDYAFTLLQKEIPNAKVNGSREQRIANNVNISIPGLDTEYAVIWLDTKGVAVSTKSACGSAKSTGSSVVREMTHDEVRAISTLRLTLGVETSQKDIECAVQVLMEFMARMQ
jgi:cysteine desulfurase